MILTWADLAPAHVVLNEYVLVAAFMAGMWVCRREARP